MASPSPSASASSDPPSSPSRSSSPSSSSSSSSSSQSKDDGLRKQLSQRSRFPGRRVVGRRIYDSELGVTCHWCRQKTVEDHVYCSLCSIAFCGGCLRNRHGEIMAVEMRKDVHWVCPKCRGGCGRGCKNCCNCGPCRKSQGFEPTGLLVHTARASGFNNVHDYLIHLRTGESQETISERKRGRGWCQTGQSSLKKPKIEKIKERLEELTWTPPAPLEEAMAKSQADSQLRVGDLKKSVSSTPILKRPKIETAQEERTNYHRPVGELSKLAPPGLKEDRGPGLTPVLDVKKESELCLPSVQIERVPHENSKDHEKKSVDKQRAVRLKEEFPNYSPEAAVIESQNQDLQNLKVQLENGFQSPTTLLRPKSEPASDIGRAESGSSIQRPTALLHPKPEPGSLFTGDETVTAPIHVSPVLQSAFLPESQCTSMGSAFSRIESDAVWSKFHADFDFLYSTSSAEEESDSSDCDEVQTKHLECRQVQTPLRATIHNRSSEAVDIIAIEAKNSTVKESKCNSGTLRPVKVESMDDKTPTSSSPLKEEVKVVCLDEEDELPQIKYRGANSQPKDSFDSVIVKKEKMNIWDVDLTLDNTRVQKFSAKEDRNEVKVTTTASEVICIADDDNYPTRNERTLQASEMKKTTGLRAPAHLWMVDNYRRELEARLLEPFSNAELERLNEAISHRKPIYKARETRHGSSQFLLHEQGYSYLDHHPDLAVRLQSANNPETKLQLLRGFFFWLQHASTAGAFKPWTELAPLSKLQEDDDCVQTDGPDCEILAIVCSVDDEQNPANDWHLKGDIQSDPSFF